MPLTLDNPIVVNETVSKVKITGFAVDLTTTPPSFFIEWDELASDNTPLVEGKQLALRGTAANQFRTDWNDKTAIRNDRALLRTEMEAVRDNAGRPGTITDDN